MHRICIPYVNPAIGSMAQLLQRWSLAGGLSLITRDLCLTCDHFVGQVSFMGQPTSLPSLWGC